MTKNEFISALRLHLTGKIPAADVESNVNYYTSYFNEQMMTGKTEEQVAEELGSPRIIAKNITDAAERQADGGVYQNNNYTYYQADPEQEDEQPYGGQTSAQGEPSTARKVLGIVITVVIIVLAIIIFSRVGLFLFRLLIPIIAILLIGGLFFGMSRRR